MRSSTTVRPLVLVFAVCFLGVVCIQLAWALVVPPFRGLDEHDHAFRAAAVARGEWKPTPTPVTQGRGELVTVPQDLSTAAQPICSALPYTRHDDCFPSEVNDDGTVRIGSAASRYNPVYYWVVGTLARPWQGANAVYAMRGATAAICAALIALAVVVARRRVASPWRAVGVMMTLTPVATYSTAVAAPNGPEMMAALLLWSTLLAFSQAGRRESRTLLVLAVTASVVLATLRALGPLWVVLVVATVWLACGARLRERFREEDRTWQIGSILVVGIALVAGAGWTLAAGTNDPRGLTDTVSGSPWPSLWQQPILWLLQSIAAFPARDEMAPPAVYAIVLALFWAMAAVAWRHAGHRARVTLAVLVAVSIIVPAAITVASYGAVGYSWQGRYGWPYSLGFFVLAGFVLPGKGGARAARVASGVVAVALASATCIGQVAVLHAQLRLSPLANSNAWHRPPDLLVIALTSTGFALVAAAVVVLPRHGVDGPPTMPADDGHPDSLAR